MKVEHKMQKMLSSILRVKRKVLPRSKVGHFLSSSSSQSIEIRRPNLLFHTYLNFFWFSVIIPTFFSLFFKHTLVSKRAYVYMPIGWRYRYLNKRKFWNNPSLEHIKKMIKSSSIFLFFLQIGIQTSNALKQNTINNYVFTVQSWWSLYSW